MIYFLIPVNLHAILSKPINTKPRVKECFPAASLLVFQIPNKSALKVYIISRFLITHYFCF